MNDHSWRSCWPVPDPVVAGFSRGRRRGGVCHLLGYEIHTTYKEVGSSEPVSCGPRWVNVQRCMYTLTHMHTHTSGNLRTCGAEASKRFKERTMHASGDSISIYGHGVCTHRTVQRLQQQRTLHMMRPCRSVSQAGGPGTFLVSVT